MTVDEPKAKAHVPILSFLEKHGFERVTLLLMLTCLAIFALPSIYQARFLQPFFISDFDIKGANEMTVKDAFYKRMAAMVDKVPERRLLPEIRHGQVWRLVTPIFLHASFLQLFFYLLWLRSLGSTIEIHRSRWLLIALVIVIATICNLTGYLVLGGSFAGMAGVVYGLAGYIGVRGALDPRTGLTVHFTIMAMMFIWFFICLVGFQGGMLITLEQLIGLVVGMTWGAIAHLIVRVKKPVQRARL